MHKKCRTLLPVLLRSTIISNNYIVIISIWKVFKTLILESWHHLTKKGKVVLHDLTRLPMDKMWLIAWKIWQDLIVSFTWSHKIWSLSWIDLIRYDHYFDMIWQDLVTILNWSDKIWSISCHDLTKSGPYLDIISQDLVNILTWSDKIWSLIIDMIWQDLIVNLPWFDKKVARTRNLGFKLRLSCKISKRILIRSSKICPKIRQDLVRKSLQDLAIHHAMILSRPSNRDKMVMDVMWGKPRLHVITVPCI